MDAFWGLYGLKKAGRRPARNLFIIEVGKRLIQAKSLVQHGHWQHWLELNFQLTYQTAAKFIQCAERFSNVATSRDLNRSQMIEMLSLPSAEETEKFIAEKAAEGKAVAEMTIKELRDEICQNKKPATARLYTVAVKTFSKWLASKGLYLDFAAGVKAPSLDEEAETHSREALTLDEARKTLSFFKDKTDEKSLRDALILRIMLNCGLRSIEIARLNATDIEHRHGKIFLKVWGKGRKGATARVEISKTVCNMIFDYLNARGSKRMKGEPMFVSCANRNRGARISTQIISKMAKATFRKVGIDSETISCHSCRHFTCTQLLLEGVDIARCQRLLRHKSAVVTERYRHDLDRATDNSVQILSNLLDAA